MAKKICFDLDGTLASLYDVPNWLEYLLNEDTHPYEVAEPLLRLSALAKRLNNLQRNGYKLIIISWLSKNGSDGYNKAVAATKIEWLEKHLPSVNWDEIHIVKYGTPKTSCGNGILFDDEEHNRTEWSKKPNNWAFDVKNILATLELLK